MSEPRASVRLTSYSFRRAVTAPPPRPHLELQGRPAPKGAAPGSRGLSPGQDASGRLPSPERGVGAGAARCVAQFPRGPRGSHERREGRPFLLESPASGDNWSTRLALTPAALPPSRRKLFAQLGRPAPPRGEGAVAPGARPGPAPRSRVGGPAPDPDSAHGFPASRHRLLHRPRPPLSTRRPPAQECGRVPGPRCSKEVAGRHVAPCRAGGAAEAVGYPGAGRPWVRAYGLALSQDPRPHRTAATSPPCASPTAARGVRGRDAAPPPRALSLHAQNSSPGPRRLIRQRVIFSVLKLQLRCGSTEPEKPPGTPSRACGTNGPCRETQKFVPSPRGHHRGPPGPDKLPCSGRSRSSPLQPQPRAGAWRCKQVQGTDRLGIESKGWGPASHPHRLRGPRRLGPVSQHLGGLAGGFRGAHGHAAQPGKRGSLAGRLRTRLGGARPLDSPGWVPSAFLEGDSATRPRAKKLREIRNEGRQRGHHASLPAPRRASAEIGFCSPGSLGGAQPAPGPSTSREPGAGRGQRCSRSATVTRRGDASGGGGEGTRSRLFPPFPGAPSVSPPRSDGSRGFGAQKTRGWGQVPPEVSARGASWLEATEPDFSGDLVMAWKGLPQGTGSPGHQTEVVASQPLPCDRTLQLLYSMVTRQSQDRARSCLPSGPSLAGNPLPPGPPDPRVPLLASRPPAGVHASSAGFCTWLLRLLPRTRGTPTPGSWPRPHCPCALEPSPSSPDFSTDSNAELRPGGGLHFRPARRVPPRPLQPRAPRNHPPPCAPLLRAGLCRQGAREGPARREGTLGRRLGLPGASPPTLRSQPHGAPSAGSDTLPLP
ncbi:collagen alpha-1(I) chain-like [Choloepus didactylus]|uniref:collagen alpha-1(I) chain-like n=1 Tax=Choloepus didactylus TaxID=27675 RepID=UPI00189FD951|nr:collagen alpha-1(I) chain-like [Choloepus didactylus]